MSNLTEANKCVSDSTSNAAMYNPDSYFYPSNVGQSIADVCRRITNNLEFNKGAKNIITFKNGKVIFDSLELSNVTVMPEIVDVHTIENNVAGGIGVVIVTFADGTSEKAVLSSDDTFSLEYGISVCVTKKLLSAKCNGQGNSVYNKIVKRGIKVYKDAVKKAAADVEKAKEEKARAEKYAQKRTAKRARREAAAREEFIEIQKEAYLRAMREFNSTEDNAK